MAVNLGVHVKQQTSSGGTPTVAESGVPYVVGTAPVHTAAKPAKTMTPVLCTSFDEAVKKLGYSDDWETYTLCEFMFSHFKLYGCQPVVFCNVLDTKTMKKPLPEGAVPVVGHQAALPFGTIREGLTVSADGAALTLDEDYSIVDGEDACIVELLEDGKAYDAVELTVTGNQADAAAVTAADIAEGVAQVDACLTAAQVVPDLICAPGWSHDPAVAAVMTMKAAGVNGLFKAKALIDAPCGEGGVLVYNGLPDWKEKNGVTDVGQIVCWPMVTREGRKFHLSTHLAGLMAQVDAGNGGCPVESPSNKSLQIDGCCLEDGTEVNLTWEQVNLIAGNWGAVTAVRFIGSGWTAKGSCTACYPGNKAVEDHSIPVSRMFGWVGNSIIRTYWSRLDKPMTRRLQDSIRDSVAIWFNGLVGAGKLLGARVEILAEENPAADLEAGIIRFHLYLTPPSPAQEIDFILEYDASYVAAALQAA